MTIRFVPREQPPQPPERIVWRLVGVRLPVVCLARDYPHGTELLLLQGDELVQAKLIRTGAADVNATSTA